MRSRRESRDVVVTDVLDGRPERWLVRKRFLGTGDNVRPMCVNTRLRGAAVADRPQRSRRSAPGIDSTVAAASPRSPSRIDGPANTGLST